MDSFLSLEYPATFLSDQFGSDKAQTRQMLNVSLTFLALLFVWLLGRRSTNKSPTVAGSERKAHGYAPLKPYTAKQATFDPNNAPDHIEFLHERIPQQDQLERATAYADFMTERRSMRFFSKDPVPMKVVEECVRAAATAPSGAHQQPWTFVVVKSQDIKNKIRKAVEAQEQVNYDKRMKKSWVADVMPLVDNLHAGASVLKPYLSEAPYLVVVMKQSYGIGPNGERQEIYYPSQGVGIASGMFINALHNANLCTLTSTPLGAEKAISELLDRPVNEKVYLLMPVGYPAKGGTVPCRTVEQLRKPLKHVMKVV